MNAKRFLTTILFIASLLNANAQDPEVIYDESKVPDFQLPALLITEDGKKVKDLKAWEKKRRSEVLELFKSEVYGEYPEVSYHIDFKENVLDSDFLDGKATMKEIEAIIRTDRGSSSFFILYVYPNGMNEVPVFTGLNFGGNHTVHPSEKIRITDSWVMNSEKRKITNNQAAESSRGVSASRWPLETIIEHGYGVATAYYGEIDPDYDDGFRNGFHPLFAEPGDTDFTSETSSISIWAKGLSFIADFLEQDLVADPDRIIVIGHSRLGKTALWAGANDERFAAVISNNSGCGGAALSMREYGERVSRINTVFPHWFCDRFNYYNDKVLELPVDQHMLLALMAPRPVYVASATEDRWADPNGEFLALKAAQDVYKFLPAYKNDFPEAQPAPETPYNGICAYHLRTGPHDTTEYDWLQYMNWADEYLGK
jgi:hypothetical protein